jgi:hypothetical protein
MASGNSMNIWQQRHTIVRQMKHFLGTHVQVIISLNLYNDQSIVAVYIMVQNKSDFSATIAFVCL